VHFSSVVVESRCREGDYSAAKMMFLWRMILPGARREPSRLFADRLNVCNHLSAMQSVHTVNGRCIRYGPKSRTAHMSAKHSSSEIVYRVPAGVREREPMLTIRSRPVLFYWPSIYPTPLVDASQRTINSRSEPGRTSIGAETNAVLMLSNAV
jgi:hypothetical protein